MNLLPYPRSLKRQAGIFLLLKEQPLSDITWSRTTKAPDHPEGYSLTIDRRGVRIEVITPGPRTDEKLVRRASRSRWGALLEAGVRIHEFQPTNFHCKLMVVDGRVGFTGGVGIADQWAGRAQDLGHWRDSHYRLEGPAVAQMQAAGTPIRAVMLDRLGPNVWHRSPAEASAVLEELEETARLWLLTRAAPLNPDQIHELREQFGAAW